MGNVCENVKLFRRKIIRHINTILRALKYLNIRVDLKQSRG